MELEPHLAERRLKLREEFDRKGAARVSAELESGQFNGDCDLMSARERLAEREAAASAARDAREEETLRIAKRANRIAWIAAAIAAISIIKDVAVAIFT